MIRGTDHILVSHAGTLPKPDDLRETVMAKASGQPVDEETLSRRLRETVADVVKRQVEIGIDTVNSPGLAGHIRGGVRSQAGRALHSHFSKAGLQGR